MPGPLWSEARGPRRWIVAVAGTASVAGSLLAVTKEKERTCGAVPLARCVVERASDLYRSATTRSCDARILPSVKERHRTIARRFWRSGRWELWLAEHSPAHARRLKACRVAKASSGSAAVEEEACAQLRESGHLMSYMLPPSWDPGVLASTERALNCEYDLTAGDSAAAAGSTAGYASAPMSVPTSQPMSWAYRWQVMPRTWRFPRCYKPGAWPLRFMSPRRRAPAARWGPSSP